MKILSQHRTILAVLLATVVLSGCTDDKGLRFRYEAEKKFHAIEKSLTEAALRPGYEMSGPERREISRQFEDVLQFCYTALDSLDADEYPVATRELEYKAFQAATRVAQQNFTARRFDTAAAVMDELISRANLGGALRLEAYLNLGQALQAAGSWDSAVTVYDYTIDNFYPPTDRNGQIIARLFNLPAHMYKVARTIGDTTMATQFLDRALDYYSRSIDEYPGTVLESQAHLDLAAIATERDQFRRAIDHLRQVNSPDSGMMLRNQMQIAQLFHAGLKQFDSARVIYDSLLAGLNTGKSEQRRMAAHLKYLKATLLLDEKQFDKAQRALVELKRDNGDYWANSPRAQLAMAQSWDMAGNWGRAEVEYTYLIDRYSTSQEAMAAYLYLIQRNRELDRAAVAEEWSERAAKAFKQLAVRGAGGPVEARALLFESRLEESKDRWEEAAATLEELFTKFPNTESGRQALIRSAAIYSKRLDRPEVADSLVERLRATLTDVEAGWENE